MLSKLSCSARWKPLCNHMIWFACLFLGCSLFCFWVGSSWLILCTVITRLFLLSLSFFPLFFIFQNCWISIWRWEKPVNLTKTTNPWDSNYCYCKIKLGSHEVGLAWVPKIKRYSCSKIEGSAEAADWLSSFSVDFLCCCSSFNNLDPGLVELSEYCINFSLKMDMDISQLGGILPCWVELGGLVYFISDFACHRVRH